MNGQPGAIFRDRDGKVLYTVALGALDGRIPAIRSVSNPDKLGHVGPVADARAVARKVNQARRAQRIDWKSRIALQTATSSTTAGANAT